MADLDLTQGQSVPLSMVSKYVDMGDGTHALQVAIGGYGTVTIPVELTAGEAHVGNVGSESADSVATPVLLGGAPYGTGDTLGGIMEFTLVSRVAGRGVVLTNLVITDLTVQAPTIELWLFDRTFTAGVDNTPWSPADADLPNIVAIVSTADLGGAWFLGANNGAARIEFVQRVGPNVTSLFGQFVVRGTPTYGVGSLQAKLNYLQD